MTDRQDAHNKQKNINQDVRAFDNAHVKAIANIENVGTLNITNHTDRNVLLDDWKPSFEHMQGRKQAIADLNIALADPKKAIACIVGLGGYGKSTLAAKLFDGWKGGRFWADLSQRSRDFREFATRAIAQLGQKSLEQVNNLPEAQLGYELAAVLQGQGYLVVLDNLESLLDGDGNLESVLWREFLQNWANDGEGSKVLITTREEPNLPKLRFSRHELRDGLEDAEGAAVLRDFKLLGTEAELVAVSQRVGGIPLSLMLIVGLLCNDYEEEPHVRFLPEDLFGIEGAHRLGRVTTEEVFRASFERLEPRLQSLLMAVSVFAKPFDRSMAAAMIADEEVTDRDLLLLKKRGFVLAESGCYRFQPQIQELVQRQAADLLELHRRAINFYLTLCEAKPTLDPRHDKLEDVDPYLQIFHHHCELGEYESAFYTIRNDSNVNDIDSFLTLCGYSAKLVELYISLIKAWQPDKSQQWEYTASLIALGNAYHCLGNYKESLNFYQKSLEIAHLEGFKNSEGSSLIGLGNVHHALGQYNESINLYQKSLQIDREIDKKENKINFLIGLGNAYYALGLYQESVNFYQRSLGFSKEIENTNGISHSLLGLSNAYHSLGDYKESISFSKKSLLVAKQSGNRKSELDCLTSLGDIYYFLGDDQESFYFIEQALEIAREIGDRRCEASSLGILSNIYYSLGDYQESIYFNKQALEIAHEIGDRRGEAACFNGLGSVYHALRKYKEAISVYKQSLDIKQRIGDKHGEARSLLNLAKTYNQLGKYKEGFFTSHRAIEILIELELPLEAMPYPKWFKSIISFAQRGKWQIALCFCIGLFAFPLFLAYLVALLLWRLIKEKVESRKWR